MKRYSFLLAASLTLSAAHAQIATSEVTVGDVIIDTATFLTDYNGNGVPDILEDFSGSGTADAFEFENADGSLVLFTDFSGDGVPDGFTDFNGSSVPDAFEDYSGSGVPDAFESGFADTTGSGIPDFFERIYPSLIASASHPDPRYAYARSTLEVSWSEADFPDMANGWLWLVDDSPLTPVTLFSGTFLPPETTALVVDGLGVGSGWFHLVPIDADMNVVASAQERFSFEVRAPAPLLSSPSHPDSDVAEFRSSFVASWEANGAENVLQGWLWTVSRSEDTVVTEANGEFLPATARAVTVPDNPYGASWFHLVGVDAEGTVQSAQQNAYRFTVGIEQPVITSESHPDADVWYIRDRFTASWTSQDAVEVVSGWRWRVAAAGSTGGVLTEANSEFLPANADYLEVAGLGHGAWDLFLAPVDAAGVIRNELAAGYSFRVIARGPVVTSPTHPDQDQAYALSNVQLEWEVPDVDEDSIPEYFFIWNNEPTAYPTEDDTRVTSLSRAFFGQPDGSHYFHIVAADTVGNLSPSAHFRVNINEITGPPAGTEPISAGFTANVTSGLAPLTVFFTNTSAGNIVAWEWDFENTGVVDSTLEHPAAVTYGTPGVYSVRLTVEGADGATDTFVAEDLITVLVPPPVADFEADPVSGEAPLTVTFADMSTGQINTRAWDFMGDGTADAVDPEAPVQHTYTEPGEYTVTLTVEGDGGSDSRAAVITVLEHEAPSADFATDVTDGFFPLTVTFTDTSTGQIDSRAWDFTGDGVIDATDPAAPVRHTYTEPGVYTVTLTVSGPGGSDTVTRPNLIAVSERPDNRPPVAVVEHTQIFLNDLGSVARLDASESFDPDGDTLFYSWREHPSNPHHGLVPPGSGIMPVLDIDFPAPGRYQFDLRVSDGVLSSEETHTITVYVPGRAGVVGLSPSDGIVRVAGARVRVHESAADAEAGTNVVDAAVSDSLGRYVLENIAPLDSGTVRAYWYRVERDGFQSSEVLQMIVRPDPGFADSRHDLQMVRGFTPLVSGKVVDTAGDPVPNALVSIIPGLGGQIYASSTGSDGRFQLSNVPKGSWVLQLRASGYRSEVRDVNVSDALPELEFTLSPAAAAAALSGTVFLHGTDRPVPGARVLLGNGVSTLADADGAFAFPDVPVGDYVVTVSRAGFEPVRLPAVRVRSGGNTVDVALAYAGRGPMVRGTVTDAESGRPVRFATAGILVGEDRLTRAAVSDATGYYRLLDVPPGGQIVRVTAPGYEAAETFVDIEDGAALNFALNPDPAWREPHIPSGTRPVAAVAQPVIHLDNLLGSATLDARASTGEGLRYIWREHPRNPVTGMLPHGSESMATIQLSGFDKPGSYIFELQVMQGDLLSANTAVAQIYAPGLAGNVHSSPTDGVIGLPNAVVRASSAHADALAWNTGSALLDSALAGDDPAGDFLLSGLSPGGYWLVARAPSGTGFDQYGPVKRRVNHSTANRGLRINVPVREHALSGIVTDAATGDPLENVRVVVAPGSLAETYRTTTDARGRYHLSAVPGGSGQPVLLMRDGYSTTVTYVDISGPTTADRALQPDSSGEPASLSGHIGALYNGTLLPLPNAEVIIGSGIARAFTDAQGEFEIHGLPPGEYFGTVRKQGYRSAGLSDFGFVSLAAGDNRIDRTLRFEGRGPVIRAKVVNAYQEPVEGAEITVLAPPSPMGAPAFAPLSADGFADPAGGAAHAASDGGGIAQLVGLPHGGRTVEIRLPDGRTYTRSFDVGGSMELVWHLPFDTLGNWKIRHFGTDYAERPEETGDFADPSRDGVPNLLKYFFGEDPLLSGPAGSRLALEPVPGEHGQRLRFRRAADPVDVGFFLEYSHNLLHWSPHNGITPRHLGFLPDGGELIEVDLPDTGEDSVFWRLGVEQP